MAEAGRASRGPGSAPAQPAVNLAALVAQKAAIHPERPAILDPEGKLACSYGDLSARAARCAGHLVARGLRAGQVLAYLGENRLEAFDLLLACARTGIVFVPVNFRLSAGEIAKLLEDAGPAAVYFDAAYEPLLSEYRAELLLRESADEPAYLNAEPLPAGHAWPAGHEALALIYTSGSSGAPKGVIQTHANAFFRAVAGVVDFELGARDVVLVAAPLFHVAGLNALTISALHVGARLLLQRRFRPEDTIDMIRAHKVSCFAIVPTVLKMMRAAANCRPEAFARLRFVLVGGEPLESGLQRQWRALGVELLNVFGMSETADGVLYQRIGEGGPANCVGHPATYALARIEGASEPGEPGELWLGGPTISPGYWRAAGSAQERFVNGWVRSGDLAYRDESGRYYLVGRADDLIKSGAEKIHPAELEEVIAALPGVTDVVVFSVPDPRWGRTPRAVIAVRPGTALDTDTVIAACKQRLAHYKRPRSVIVVDELPMTGSGKVDRARIKREYGDDANV